MTGFRLPLCFFLLLSLSGCSVLRYAPPEIGEPLQEGYLKILAGMCQGMGPDAEAGALVCVPAVAVAVMDAALVATEMTVESIVSPSPMTVPAIRPSFGISLGGGPVYRVP